MKIYCVGIGPGSDMEMTPKALKFITDADVIVGYDLYVDMIRHLINGKEIVTSPMKREMERCKTAVDLAISGKKVAVISGGDAGVYGMAGLIHEIVSESGAELEVETAAGVTAANAAAAILGAPLTNDYAVISLSDLLTPWEQIENRVRHAVQGDLVLCIYNPSSTKRAEHLNKICKIAMEYIHEDTCCGYVRNISRSGEESKVLTLGELALAKTDMFTTVVIGNKFTRIINGRLITPRGYKLPDRLY